MILAKSCTSENVMGSSLPMYTLQEWSEQFPWAVAGITYKGAVSNIFDLRKEDINCDDRMQQIQKETGFNSLVRIPQVHGTNLLVHDSELSGYIVLTEAADCLLYTSDAADE